jgi:hypothetical protein
MAVSERDRGFFSRVGDFKASSHALTASEHLALPLAERLSRSWQLFESFPQGAGASRRDADPAAFYERARALGFYRR